MRISVAQGLLALSVVAGAGYIGLQATPAVARAPEAQPRPAETPKAGTTPAVPAAPTKWPIGFGDTAAPSTRVDAKNELKLAVLVTNSAPEAQGVIVKVVLRNASGTAVKTTVACPALTPGAAPPAAQTATPPAKGKAKGKSVEPTLKELPVPAGACKFNVPANEPVLDLPLTVTVEGAARDTYPLSGAVAMWPALAGTTWSEPQPRVTLALTGIPLESAPTVDWYIVVETARFAAGACVAGMVACLVIWGSPLRRMGDAKFSFTDSWSSALMLGTPLLTAFLTTFTSFPDQAQTMSKKSYLLLSILLSAIIALAPALFNLCKLPTRVTKADGTVETQSQGVMPFFFVAAFVALTGGLGQLQLLKYVVSDLAAAAFLSAELRTSLVWSADALFWVVLVTSIGTMIATVAAATASDASQGRGSWGARLQTAANAPAPEPNTRLPTWSLP